jgi:hypothetical protein
MPTSKTCTQALYALSAALALAACTLPTKLAELTGGGEGPGSADSTGDQATGDDTLPINSGDSGDTVAMTTGEACSPVTLTRKPVSPNVVLVLDKSGSMVSIPGGLWDHDADPMTPDVTRWSSLHQVVESIVTDFDDAINFGAHLFPGTAATSAYNADACQISATIDIAVAADNGDAVLAGIPAETDTSLRGGTPVAAGVTVALDHLKTLDADVPRAVILVTDGAANCAAGEPPPAMFEDYDESLHALVDDAFSIDSIPTYVVGVGIADITSSTAKDGSPDDVNTFDRLNQLALEGGKPRNDPDQKFFNTDNQLMLAAALSEIAADALTCIIALDEPPLAPGQTVVVLGETTLAHVEDCASEDGWVFVHPDGPFDTLELCGAACSGFKIAGEADVTVCLPE